MPYDPKLHHRRTIRLNNFDYTAPGAYFITVTSFNKKSIFGDCKNNQMILSTIGNIARSELEKLPKRFPDLEVDQYVIMPNHIHFILVITEREGKVKSSEVSSKAKFGAPIPGSIATIIRSYKSAVTNQVRKVRIIGKEPIFQGNYYEHIIRNDQEWGKIRAYILVNPDKWSEDSEYR